MPEKTRSRSETAVNAGDDRLARAWIRFQRNWWAFEETFEVCGKHPRRAMRLLVRLTELANTDELVRDIGAGPLEDFIGDHAPKFIAQLERTAIQKPRFRRALRSVRLPEAKDSVTLRLFALGCSPVEGVRKNKWQTR